MANLSIAHKIVIVFDDNITKINLPSKVTELFINDEKN